MNGAVKRSFCFVFLLCLNCNMGKAEISASSCGFACHSAKLAEVTAMGVAYATADTAHAAASVATSSVVSGTAAATGQAVLIGTSLAFQASKVVVNCSVSILWSATVGTAKTARRLIHGPSTGPPRSRSLLPRKRARSLKEKDSKE